MSFIKNLFSNKTEVFQEAEILLEQNSPSCPITAIVEQDNRVVYFYLWGPENSNFGVKCSWVRNLKDAPDKQEKALMEKGISPMQTKQYCKFPEGQEKLEADKLSIIWLEEGDAAALLSDGEILAIIPSWAGQGDFLGYARAAKGHGDFAWELSDSNQMYDRISKAQEFWNAWDLDINPFNSQQPLLLDAYDKAFGKQDKYYAIDGNEWPPKGLYLRQGTSKTVFATVGLSLLPMPAVEMYTDNRFETNRIELGIILDSTFTDKDIQEMGEWISGQSSLPWDNITFLGEGHTLNFNPFNSTKFDYVILTNKLNVLPQSEIEDYRHSKINLLWMVPISEKERQHVIDNGSADIIERLNQIGEHVFSLNRDEII
ncbi:suppressor of fused domain protein [Olleya sp. HaHaR_3_96]|uniref:suppressor of fused domain protein n=1 Tax=Olleya sp. HaHaR_3_96 TaxID=2745560 RepID=UPI001C4FD6AD|nr:suppressor of fused domain protein [Olleya sp. HaHaR_3_96]QXP59453.1 suppressor of fused domain protein [Olleya sp. HaHaR_3_96]